MATLKAETGRLLDDLCGHQMAIQIDAVKDLDNEIIIVDRLTDVSQLIGDPFEAGAVAGDRRITLADVVQLSLQVDVRERRLLMNKASNFNQMPKAVALRSMITVSRCMHSVP